MPFEGISQVSSSIFAKFSSDSNLAGQYENVWQYQLKDQRSQIHRILNLFIQISNKLMAFCKQPKQVFEYTTLVVKKIPVSKRRHWQLLGWYNEAHGGRYFDLTPNGVRFKQFVRVVIQAGGGH